MASIFLIRHGQASFGSEDYDKLSGLGLQQAKLAGEYLGRTPNVIERIVSGTLVRQRQTAEAIAASLERTTQAKLNVQIDARLNEIESDLHMEYLVPLLNVPPQELQTLRLEAKKSSRAYQKLLRRVFLHWQRLADCPESMESWVEFSGRVTSMLHEALQTGAAGTSTLMITSGGVIATVVQQILRLPATATYPLFEVMQNCSITHLLHDRKQVSLSSFNECSYLRTDNSVDLVTYR